jgi:uncharacterized YigZ family protein
MSGGPDSYRVVTGRGTSLIRERASKFIGIAFPVPTLEAFKEELSATRKEHHTARHWCYGHVIGEQGDVHRSSDDGEPSGTAGRPILRHIQGAGLTYTGVIVVRYFGGTLLGKGGLVQAYGEAAASALAQAPQEVRVIHGTITVQCGHAAFEGVRADVQRSGGRVLKAEYHALCEAVITVPRSLVQPLLARWSDAGITCRMLP